VSKGTCVKLQQSAEERVEGAGKKERGGEG